MNRSTHLHGALIVETQLAPLLIDEDHRLIERLWEKMYRGTVQLGRRGLIIAAISGVDIALWDLMGQACGQPVSRLLGGRFRERVQPYGSILFDEPEPLRRTLEEVVPDPVDQPPPELRVRNELW